VRVDGVDAAHLRVRGRLGRGALLGAVPEALARRAAERRARDDQLRARRALANGGEGRHALRRVRVRRREIELGRRR
jgi:hypothetical protein